MKGVPCFDCLARSVIKAFELTVAQADGARPMTPVELNEFVRPVDPRVAEAREHYMARRRELERRMTVEVAR